MERWLARKYTIASSRRVGRFLTVLRLTNLMCEFYNKNREVFMIGIIIHRRMGGIVMLALSDTIPGKRYTIKWMFGIPEALEMLQNLQIREGSVVRIIKKYKDCVIIAAENKRVAIGREIADRIKV